MASQNQNDPSLNGDALHSDAVWKLRRGEPRVTLKFPICLIGKDKADRPFVEDTVTENVSRHGACVETIQEMEVGMLIQVSAFDQRFLAQARVAMIWSRRSQSGKYRVGLRFVDAHENWIIH
ncbi:MAG: PilZ domain-containing protein [Acidobacteriia bacterium]|nr:PilZ domain-containing protein [Terriglobia bacterium]